MTRYRLRCADGKALTRNYQAGEGLCECCKLGFAFTDSGRTVYMVDREVDGNQIRNHVLHESPPTLLEETVALPAKAPVKRF